MSDENHDFASIGLDEIAQLAQVDNDHAPEIREQAQAAADLYGRVTAAITEITKAADNITVAEWGAVGAVFEGKAGNATRQTVTKLSEATGSAHKAMEPQSAVFTGLADQAESAHHHISRLRADREHWLGVLAENPKDPKLNVKFGKYFGLGDDDPQELEREIRRHYDSDARETMSTATSGYLTEVERLKPVGSYHGPRSGRPDSGSPAYHPDADYRPGPGLRPEGPQYSDSPSKTAPAVHHAPPVEAGSAQPDLQSGAPAPAPHAPGPVGTPPASEVYVPNKPVVPPVIGARPGPGPFSGTAPNRQTGGLSRPVIGARPAPGPGSSPNRQPGGLTRPVIGGRTAPGVPTSPSRQPNGLTRPVIGSRPGAPTTGARPGSSTARSAPARQPGGLSRPVIGSRPNPATGTAASRNGQAGAVRPGSTGSRPTPSRQPGVRSHQGTASPTGATAHRISGPPRPGTGNRSGSSGSWSPANRPGAQGDALGSQQARSTAKPGVRTGSGRADTAPRGRVIGRASVPPPNRAKQPSTQDTDSSPQADWYPVSATVPPVIHGVREEPVKAEFDPGEHLTRDNLGKNRGIHDDQR